MTPKEKEMLKTALNQVRKKHIQLAKEEGIEEGKKEVAKKLKKLHSPEEISKITSLTSATISKL